MVVKDVQRLTEHHRHKLEILGFPLGFLLNSTTYHFVSEQHQNICVPNEDVVDISFADPDRLCSTVHIKLIQDEFHNLLSSLIFVIVFYVENLADAKSMHGLPLADGADEIG